MNTLLTRVGIHEPGRSGDTAQQGIPILRGKAEASDFMSIPHRQRRCGDHCLVEDTSKKPMIPAKGKDRVGHGFFRQGNISIRLEFLNHLVQRHRSLDLEVEPDAMHVLRVQLNRRGKEIEIKAARVEQVPSIPRVMCAKLRLVVFPSLWRRNKTLGLADITGAPPADKAAFK